MKGDYYISPDLQRFKILGGFLMYVEVTQLVEWLIEDQLVGGSNPPFRTNIRLK